MTGSDFNVYVAKNDKGQTPSLHHINEVLAKYLLTLWELPVPDCAIIDVDISLLSDQELSNNHRVLNYQRPCFGSRWVENAIDVNDFLSINDRKTFNKILNPKDFLRFALFDEWVQNDDRKPSNYNLIMEPKSGKFKITAIDHAFIFESLAYSNLDAEHYSPKSNDHLLISNLGNLIIDKTLIDNQLITAEREYFYLYITKCEEHFKDILDEINRFYPVSDEDSLAVRQYLFNSNRNQLVFNEHTHRLINA